MAIPRPPLMSSSTNDLETGAGAVASGKREYESSGGHDHEETSDYSGSGEHTRTRVQSRRRPYETFSTFLQNGHARTGGENVPAAIDLPSPNPSSPVTDLDFDAKLSSAYQGLDEWSRQSQSDYTDLFRKGRHGGENGQSLKSATRGHGFVHFLAFIALLALSIACIGVGLACYGIFVDNPQPQDDTRLTELETQLSSSQKMIDRLTSMVEELRQNVSDHMNTRDTETQQLEQQVNELSQAVDELRNQSTTVTTTTATTPPDVPVTPALTVNISGNCAYEEIKTCPVTTDLLTPVDDAALGSLPNYGSCDTLHLNLTETDTYVQDVYCAITNTRNERNPIMATLIHDEDNNTVWCQCYVTAIEARIGVVECGLFVRRCPSIVQVE